MAEIKLHPSWKPLLGEELKTERMKKLRAFLAFRHEQGKKIFPKVSEYFAAFNATPFEKVRVVILGQDPYHGQGQAHGLCFSVQEGVPFPPSLLNIFKELKTDLGFEIPQSGNLKKWAEQGVLLLNSVLTVEEGKAASHQGKGWEPFTDKVIEVLNQEKEGLVFVLWGAYAQKKGAFLDRQKHLVIECAHPSPLSAYRGFFGSKPFSQINHYLESRGHKPIYWQL